MSFYLGCVLSTVGTISLFIVVVVFYLVQL